MSAITFIISFACLCVGGTLCLEFILDTLKFKIPSKFEGILGITLLIIGLTFMLAYQGGYDQGYQQAIEDAHLVAWDNSGYDIVFDGQIHHYG